MYIPLCSLNVFTPIDSIRTMVFNWEQNMCLSICFHKDNIKETCVWNAREKQGAFLENKKNVNLLRAHVLNHVWLCISLKVWAIETIRTVSISSFKSFFRYKCYKYIPIGFCLDFWPATTTLTWLVIPLKSLSITLANCWFIKFNL